MNSSQEANPLIPLLVSIRVVAIDADDQSVPSNDYFHISARLTGWTDRIVAGLLPNPGSGNESATMDLLVGAAKDRLLAFMNQMLAGGVLSEIGYCQFSSRGIDASGCDTGKIKIESSATWRGIESFEREAIQELARLFDAGAAMEIETSHGNDVESLSLSTGDLLTDAPTFGTSSPIPMTLGVFGRANAISIAFNAEAEALKKVMSAGPAAFRSTPGGRRDLTLLFLENEIEAALASIGTPDAYYEIMDATDTDHKSIAVMFDPDDQPAIALADIASALCQRWPEIIS